MSKVPPEEFPEPGREDRGGVDGNRRPIRDEDTLRRAILEQKQFVTGRISETVRYIGFGLLALFYAMISADTAIPAKIVSKMPEMLQFMAVFGVLAISLDYLQYFFGDRAVEFALSGSGEAANRYNTKWFVYRARTWCYWLKQVSAMSGCVFLIVILLRVMA